MALAPLTPVTYLVSGVSKSGKVLIYLDAQNVLVSDSSSNTTQRLLPESALTFTPPTPPTPPPTSTWPFPGVVEPKLPTGLTRATTYADVDGREYVGITTDAAVKNKRVVFRDCTLGWLGVSAPAEDVWVIGGSLGPNGGGTHPMVATGFETAVAKRVVFDGVHIHGMHQGTTDDHTEGLQVGGVDTLIVRNCTFDDNHVMNMFLRCWSPATIKYVLIENNKFGPVSSVGGGPAYYSLRVAGDGDATRPQDIYIRNNTYPKNYPFSIDASVPRVVQTGNVGV